MSAIAWGAAAVLAPAASRGDEPAALEVEVRGDVLPDQGEDPTLASSVLDGEDVARPGESTTDALARVPGVQVARTGNAAELATVTLRGASGAQVPVYLAGVLLNDELHGAADLSTVPLFFLRRVEVIRGHGPIDLDRAGLAGAVLLEPTVPSGTRAGVGFGAGSWGERTLQAIASAGHERAAAAVAVRLSSLRGDFSFVDDRGTRFDPSDDREVVRENADAREVDAWSVLRMDLGARGSWSTVVNGMAREQGVPGLGVVPARRARATRSRALALSRFTFGCAGGEEAGCAIRVTTFAKRTTYFLEDPLRELPYGTTRQDVVGTSAGAQIGAAVDAEPWLTVDTGAGSAVESLVVDPAGARETHALRSSARAFGTLLFRPAAFAEVRVAGAVDSQRTDASEVGAVLVSPTARAGVAFFPVSWVRLFATVARYERTPTLGEQYGGAAGIVGNPTLSPESGPAADAGAKLELSAGDTVDFGAEVVAFGRYATDLIAFRRSAAGILRPYNVASARFLGVEGAVAARFVRLVRVEASAAFSDPRDVTEGRELENDLVPHQARIVTAGRVALEAEDIARREGLDDATLGVSLVYRGPRVADPAGLVALPSQVLLEVDASLTLARGMLRLRSRASNLLDDDTTDLVGYPLPGRAGHVSIEGMWP